MSLEQIKQVLQKLSLGQLKKFDHWLHAVIKRTEGAARAEQSSRRMQAAVGRTLDIKTYRLESIRCGKEKCKSVRGKLHGPYWYSYTRINDKVTSQYMGKRLPKDIEKKLKSLRGKSIS